MENIINFAQVTFFDQIRFVILKQRRFQVVLSKFSISLNFDRRNCDLIKYAGQEIFLRLKKDIYNNTSSK